MKKETYLLEIEKHNGEMEWFEYTDLDLAIARCRELGAIYGWRCNVSDEEGKCVRVLNSNTKKL